jgi:hypothetical protein
MQMQSSYIVIEHHDMQELQRIVNHHLNNGWEPLGGIAMTAPFSERQQIQMAQALVLKERSSGI